MLKAFRYIPTGSIKVSDKQSDAVAYICTSQKGALLAYVYVGKQTKPVLAYTYRSEAARAQAVTRAFEARRATVARKVADLAERKSFVHDFKVGDILNTCWGYDQTNREFFEVVAVKGTKLVLREIAQVREETGRDSGICAPQPGHYIGPEIIRLAGRYGAKIDNVRRASKWSTGTIAGVQIGPNLSWSAYA